MQYPLEQNWTIDNYTVNGGFNQQHPYGPQTQNDDDNASGILMFYMWMILYFILVRREGQMELAHEEVELQRQQRGGREESEEDSDQRKARIEKSLMVKQVLENTDAQGRQRLGELSSIENKDTAQHVDSQTQEEGDYDEDDSQCCVICLEPFRTGDIVAWGKPHNSSTPCSHVFHRDCIESWLMDNKHDDCPSCRNVLLHDDDDDDCEGEDVEEGGCCSESGSDDEPTNTNKCVATSRRRSRIFVIIDGLVSQSRRASYSLIASPTMDNILEDKGGLRIKQQQQQKLDDVDEGTDDSSFIEIPLGIDDI